MDLIASVPPTINGHNQFCVSIRPTKLNSTGGVFTPSDIPIEVGNHILCEYPYYYALYYSHCAKMASRYENNTWEGDGGAGVPPWARLSKLPKYMRRDAM
jgi:hypothetical protein